MTSFRITSRYSLMEKIDQVVPYYKKKLTTSSGYPVRYLNVDNFYFTTELLGDVQEISIDIEFGSDQGKVEVRVILKEFTSLEVLEEEMVIHYKLQERCDAFVDLEPVPIIACIPDELILIYDKIEGDRLQDLEIPKETKFFLLGRVIAAMQGRDHFPLEERVIREYIIFLLTHLPKFTDEEREGIIQFLENHFSRIEGSVGAYAPVVSVQEESLVFVKKQGEFTSEKVKAGEIFTIFIQPQFSLNLMGDRMFDLAMIFCRQAFDEFISTNEIRKVLRDLSAVMNGYKSALFSLGVPQLDELYPSGLTLDLHFLTTLWLEELSDVDENERPFSLEDRYILLFSYYMLTEDNFNLFL
ncbi:MAG: hypothetical protein INQ03_06495 [Candidatus Heimdallarchaeota archaeon]|nr:hypothetical protein [Candidatus Heimdallarchaeota archaeon]